MVVLRSYSVADIGRAANELREQFERGVVHPGEFWLAQNLFRFRDSAGCYWYLQVRRNRWYRFDGEIWRPATSAPERLEGVDALPVYSTALPEQLEQAPPDNGPTVPAAQAVAGIAEMIRSAYREGRIASTPAEMLLSRQCLLDHRGAAWTVGVCSGKWYSFQDGGWKPSAQPPAPSSLLRFKAGPYTCPSCGKTIQTGLTCACGRQIEPEIEGAADEIYPALYRFLMFGLGSLPERITPPWGPPGGFPEAAEITCANCGAAVEAGKKFCVKCGTALTPAGAMQ